VIDVVATLSPLLNGPGIVISAVPRVLELSDIKNSTLSTGKLPAVMSECKIKLNLYLNGSFFPSADVCELFDLALDITRRHKR
jgi:hypothetical protein